MKRLTITLLAAVSLQGGIMAWSAPPADATSSAPLGRAESSFRGLPGLAAAIADAHEDLRISELTYERIQAELAALGRQPDVDPTVLRDYSIYLETVRAMMHTHEQTVAALTASDLEPLEAGERPRWAPVESIEFDPPVTMTRKSALSQLDDELDESLADFDAFILEEQYEARRRRERAEEESEEDMTNLAMEAAAAVERLREKGIEIDTKTEDGGESSSNERAEGEGAEGSEGPPGGAAGRGEEGEGESGGGMPGSGEAGSGEAGSGEAGEGASGGGAPGDGGSGSGASGSGGSGNPTEGAPGGGAGGGTSPPPDTKGDRPPANDDDIVARQLREAAERETDPVLKEKLWEEYDRYKRST